MTVTNQPGIPPDPSGISWPELVGGLITGLISSGIISYLFYRRQRRLDEKEQRNFIIFLYTLWKQGVHVTDVTERIEQKLDSVLGMRDSSQKLQLLETQYDDASTTLWQAYRKKDKARYFEAALMYKQLADARADTAISQRRFDVLESDGRITLTRIQKAHSEMFPQDYAWSGTLRKEMVAIVGNFQAAGRMVNPSLSSYTVQLVSPEEIADRLDALIQRWNDNVVHLRQDDLRALAEELAHFHHDFLLIHPFLDGNGRVARIILNEQASFFLDSDVKISFDREAYYQALHLSDMRELDQLTQLIQRHLEEHRTTH